MKLMTSERCPDCQQIVYMHLHRKDLKNDLVIGDGCYLDQSGVLCIVNFDEDTKEPDYVCIHCGWIA